jgi:tetratricopeptide (TPR) repeat protein
MLRSLLRPTLLILILETSLFGQGVTDGRQSTLPASGSAQPSTVAPGGAAQSIRPGVAAGPLSEANRYYRRGQFDAAILIYNMILERYPDSPDAYAGLIRVYLKQKDVDQAYQTALKGLKAADSPTVHVAMGEVLFRLGRIPEADNEWLNVVNQGNLNARAYWGLSRVRAALSLYAQAKRMLDKARELDPADPDIQRYWINSLSRAEQIQFWENYLASPTNDDAETRADLQHRLDYLKAMEKQPHHACRLVTQVPSTETKLVKLLEGPTLLRGYALEVSVNGKKSKLMLDTGASGILIDPGLAHKADITEVSETSIGGIGDKERASAYLGFANSLKIGELEFQDCRVSVLEKRSALDVDGLIGGDVFNHFLVDIDFPKKTRRR